MTGARRLESGRLVIASHNTGKVSEFAELLAPHGARLVSAGELGLPEPKETGTSFKANAALKAEAVFTLVLSSLTRRDVGDTDPTAASLALAHSAARNISGLRRAHAEFWAGYWDVGAAVSLGSRSLLEGWWYAPAEAFS